MSIGRTFQEGHLKKRLSNRGFSLTSPGKNGKIWGRLKKENNPFEQRNGILEVTIRWTAKQ